MIPGVGARFLGGEGKFTWVMEYIGPNPAPQYESQDAYLVRRVETYPGGPKVGDVSAVEAKWFETHRAVRGTGEEGERRG